MSLRIVSLLPSATEIVCALGLRENLVGVSHECDFPSDVVGLPIVTAPKIDVDGSSREIHEGVTDLVKGGLSVYRIHTELLGELAPDLIVTQDQCEVCAVSYDDVVGATRELTGTPAEIVSLSPRRLRDVWRDVETVATAAGIADRGEAMATELAGRMASLERRTRRLERTRIACVEWLEPLMAAGNWVPELVEAAGGTSDLVGAGAHSPWMEFEDLQRAAPDVLCAMPCGFDLAKTSAELRDLLRESRWDSLAAVRNDRVFAVDGNAYFNRPGPRLVESAEILAGLLHPGDCADLLPDGAWAKLTRTS